MTAADAPGRLRRIRERGGRIVVVDPRRSETAEIADEHLFIKPGSDAFFLFALVHVLFEEGLVSLGRLEPDGARHRGAAHAREGLHARGGGERHRHRRRRPRAGSRASSPRAEQAACYGRIGTCTQEFGTLASWLVDVVNVLTGNLDREGGAMFPRAAAGPGRDRPEARRQDLRTRAGARRCATCPSSRASCRRRRSPRRSTRPASSASARSSPSPGTRRSRRRTARASPARSRRSTSW